MDREAEMSAEVPRGPKPVETDRCDIDAASAQSLNGIAGFVRDQDERVEATLRERLSKAQGLVVRAAEYRVVDDEEDPGHEALGCQNGGSSSERYASSARCPARTARWP